MTTSEESKYRVVNQGENVQEDDKGLKDKILEKLSTVILVPFVWFTILLTIDFLSISTEEPLQAGTYLSVEFWVTWVVIFLATSIVVTSSIFVLLAGLLLPYYWITDRKDSD